MEMTNKRYKLFRRLMKSIIIILFLLSLINPIVEVAIHVYCDSCMVPTGDGGYITSFHGWLYIHYRLWGFNTPYMPIPTEYFILNPIYYFTLILIWIGFFLNFGNIKRSYKNKIINKNLGYISALLVLMSTVGMYITTLTTNIGFNHPSISLNLWERTVSLGTGFSLLMIIVALITIETFILNRIRLIKEVKEIQSPIQTPIDNNLKYCHSCGAKIKKIAEYCEYCGANQ